MALDSLLRSVNSRLLVLDCYLNLCETFERSTDIGPINSEFRKHLIDGALRSADQTEEKVFRHCSVITRLYALFENYAEASASYWLSRLPFYKAFSDCEESFQNTYRCGVARLLQHIEKNRYRHLDLKVVTAQYLAALSDAKSWEIVPEAIVARDSNLRKSELEAIFSSSGIPNSWTFIENHPDLKSITTGGGGSASTLDDLLNELVSLRNDASHGAPDEILGIDVLRSWVRLVTALCGAIADLIWSKLVSEEIRKNSGCVIGVVTEVLSNGICIATCGRGLLKTGDSLFFFKKSNSSCLSINIDSLQLDGVAKEKIVVAEEGVEIGIKTRRKAHVGSLLIKLPEER